MGKLFKSWRQMSPSRRREAIAGYLFISPWMVGFVLFTGVWRKWRKVENKRLIQ